MCHNRGASRRNLESLTLTGYRSTLFPQMNVSGLACGRQAILWAQNAQYNWKKVAENASIPTIPKTRTTVHGLPNGNYTLIWWDTAKGKVLKREAAVCRKRTLPLSLPAIKTDVALHIQASS